MRSWCIGRRINTSIKGKVGRYNLPASKKKIPIGNDVKVTVLGHSNGQVGRLGKLTELGNIIWDKFKDFWASIIVLIIATTLFLVRNKLKLWFGFEES